MFVYKHIRRNQDNKHADRNRTQNTHRSHTTQAERQVEKKVYTYDTKSLKQANRQGMGWGETEAIIGKAPGVGIHTMKFKRDIQQVMPSVNVIAFSERNISGTGTQFYQVR